MEGETVEISLHVASYLTYRHDMEVPPPHRVEKTQIGHGMEGLPFHVVSSYSDGWSLEGAGKGGS